MKKMLFIFLLGLFTTTLVADQNAILENQKSEDVKKQASGDYPELNREPTIPLAAIQRAWDKAPREAGTRTVIFHPEETIRLIVREYMTTTIVFPKWETIDHVIVGDESNYQHSKPENNIVVIHPTSYVGLDTSITIIGKSGQVYGFYVRTEGYNSKNISDIKVIVKAPIPSPLFLSQQRNTTSLEEKSDYLEEAYLDSSKLDFKFTMKGDESIAPDTLYSDGIRTWFVYGDKLDRRKIPTFYHVVDGYLQAINVVLDNDGFRLIVDASGSFVLKSGDKETCIEPTKGKT